MTDRELLSELLKAGEEYLFCVIYRAAPVLTARPPLDKAREVLLDAIDAVHKRMEAQQ